MKQLSKTNTFSFLGLGLFLISSTSGAFGGIDSGGGSGLFARGALVFFDLRSNPAVQAEAPKVKSIVRQQNKMTLENFDMKNAPGYDYLMENLDPALKSLIEPVPLSNSWLATNAELKFLNDVSQDQDEDLANEDLVQIAIFKDFTIYLQQAFVGILSAKSQAGLFVHESVRYMAALSRIRLTTRDVQRLSLGILNGTLSPADRIGVERIFSTPGNPHFALMAIVIEVSEELGLDSRTAKKQLAEYTRNPSLSNINQLLMTAIKFQQKTDKLELKIRMLDGNNESADQLYEINKLLASAIDTALGAAMDSWSARAATTTNLLKFRTAELRLLSLSKQLKTTTLKIELE